jgi:serine/threonine-protein kinase RsbW
VGESFTLSIPNIFDAIGPANDAASAWLDARQVSPDAAFLVSLALEELVTNCIKYGYDDTGEHTIRVELSVADHQLAMVVIDDGRPFDPLDAPQPELRLPVADRPIGGLGLHLLRKKADEMTYERRAGTNRVTLVKRLS